MFTLPSLPYSLDALEPHLDARTLELHHGQHHAGYVAKLNSALEKHPDLLAKPIKELLRSLSELPEEVRVAVRNHGGGHFNHSLFWKIMAPDSGGEPEGDLASAIASSFGDFPSFQEKFSAAAAGLFGSGWAWLSADSSGALSISSSSNQDSPLSTGQTPILGLDVWEHAYYLKYQNRRADYISAWWNVVSWPAVAANLAALHKPNA